MPISSMALNKRRNMKLAVSTLTTLAIGIAGIFSDNNPQLDLILIILLLISAAFSFVFARQNNRDVSLMKERLSDLIYSVGPSKRMITSVAESIRKVISEEIEYEFSNQLMDRLNVNKLLLSSDIVQETIGTRKIAMGYYLSVDGKPETETLVGFVYFGEEELISFHLLNDKKVGERIKTELKRKWDTNEWQDEHDIHCASFTDNFRDLVLWFVRSVNDNKDPYFNRKSDGVEFAMEYSLTNGGMIHKIAIPSSDLVDIMNEARVIVGAKLINFLRRNYSK
jgi:hypothetical protein